MKLLKLIKVMAILTSFALIYIHLQMKIFDLAYQGKNKEKEMRNLIDDNGNVTYNILKLKSSNNLGQKLLGEQSHLQFSDNAKVVKVETSPSGGEENALALSTGLEKKANFFINLFSLKSQAEAKPLEPTYQQH